VIEGYVTIQTASGTNITAPAGLRVYTKQQGITIPNVAGSLPTDASGFYLISVGNGTLPAEGATIDVWVQGINATQIVFSYHNNPYNYPAGLNLTLMDTTPPTIQVVSPLPQGQVSSAVPIWINATLTDNLAIDPTSIKMTLNGTQLTWAFDNTTGLLSSQTGPLTQGFYIANITASDIVGNTAVQTWNFTAGGLPPTVTITSPTTGAPTYTQSGKSATVIFSYTEPNPLNWTITISNATYSVASVSNSTAITPGTSTATVSVAIPSTAVGGTYNLAVTMYNTFILTTTATQTNAVIVDNTLPTVIINYPAQGDTVSGSPVWVNGTVTETNMGSNQPTINTTGFTLQWNPTTGAFAFSTSSLSNGTYTVSVSFTDLAGNSGSSTVTFTFMVPEFPSFAVLLLALTVATTLALAASRTGKRKRLLSQ